MPISTQTASILVGVASVIFAAALTIVTYWYYKETEKQTAELKKTREEEFKPVLTPTIIADGGREMYLAVENTGKGAAHNVCMSWKFEYQHEEIEWESPLVSADERHKFFLPFDMDGSRVVTPEEILDKLEEDTMLEFEACCYDSFENKVCNSEDLDVREIVSKRRESGEIPEKADTQKVARELTDLNRSFSTITENWDIDSFISSTISKRILEVIEQHEPLTVGEIIDITSVDPRHVQGYLSELSDTDVVELEGDRKEPSPYNPDTVVSLNT